MTPLFMALILIEIADVIFAVDSVPAIFLITTDPFIVYTSNIFAILGLRALYFALAAMVHRFAYLKYALSVLLIFIGSKIFIAWGMGWEKFRRLGPVHHRGHPRLGHPLQPLEDPRPPPGRGGPVGRMRRLDRPVCGRPST